MKTIVLSIVGCIGSAFALAFGGWTAALTTLCVLMAADYITGMIVAGLFHRSPKTESGGLSSNIGWKGLARKCVVLLFVFIAHRMDTALGSAFLKDGVCVAYIFNELVSLVENAGLMGVPVPDVLLDAIDAFRGKDYTD